MNFFSTLSTGVNTIIDTPTLTNSEFEQFRKMIYDTAGINLSDAKKTLISSRLAKRVKHFGLTSYAEYFKLVKNNVQDEYQTAVDLLTTNETFFFREPKHFDFLRDRVLPEWCSNPKRVWSAASSTGEEAYTLSMVLAEYSPTKAWEIVGTDISRRVVEQACTGQYPMTRAEGIPPHYLSKYCLKGIGSQAGTFIVCEELRARIKFLHANLKSDLSKLGNFDLIFLRNVLIYFDMETKQQVVTNLLRHLKRGGYLIVSHSESLNGVTQDVNLVVPSTYRRH